jgi:hypothetical protein
MKITLEIEFVNRRCNDCGAFWACEKERNYRADHCPCCATDKIVAANERADAAVRSAAASKANATRKLNRRA